MAADPARPAKPAVRAAKVIRSTAPTAAWAAVAVVLAAASAAMAGCSRPAPPRAHSVPPVVQVVAARLRPYTPTIESFGTLSYRSKTDVASPLEGSVAEIDVEEGDRVRAGDRLARIENVQLLIARSQAESHVRSAEAAVRLAEARLCEGRQQVEARLLALSRSELEIEQKLREAEDAERTLRRRQALVKVDGISEEELASLELRASSARAAHEGLLRQRAVDSIGLRDEDLAAAGFQPPADPRERLALLTELNVRTLIAQLEAAGASLKAARSDLEAASALVEALTLRSPVAGSVGSRSAGIGERVAVGDILLTLIDDSELYAIFPVTERRAASLALDMAVEVTVPALGNRSYASRLSIISPLLDPTSGNLTVRSLLANRDGALRPGLFVRARVQTGKSRPIISLPDTSLVRREGERATIFVARGGHSFERSLLLESGGEDPDGMVRVAGGLSEGELVIDEPPPSLKDGGEIRVAKE